jgi:hypothetical protein
MSFDEVFGTSRKSPVRELFYAQEQLEALQRELADLTNTRQALERTLASERTEHQEKVQKAREQGIAKGMKKQEQQALEEIHTLKAQHSQEMQRAHSRAEAYKAALLTEIPGYYLKERQYPDAGQMAFLDDSLQVSSQAMVALCYTEKSIRKSILVWESTHATAHAFAEAWANAPRGVERSSFSVKERRAFEQALYDEGVSSTVVKRLLASARNRTLT